MIEVSQRNRPPSRCTCKSFVKLVVAALIVCSLLAALFVSLSLETPRDENAGNDGSTVATDIASSAKRPFRPPPMEFSKDVAVGILSQKPTSFFRKLQQNVDDDDPYARCQRYGFKAQDDPRPPRRLFYGSLIAEEPEELMEIVAAEAYGIYAAMVLVESNRTQNFVPRPVKRANNPERQQRLQQIFGTPQLQIRLYTNEKPKFTGIRREHAQRQEILRGWKELGMTPDDVGVLADADESFSRDFLRAAQMCDNIPAFDYESHRCHTGRVKMAASSQVFETSPECVTESRGWYHPEMVLGHCIEMIGNRTIHPLAFRDGPRRVHGYGRACDHDFSKLLPGRHPLWSASDFRMLCGSQVRLTGGEPGLYSNYTGFHLHNFFSDFNATRMKYHTYGHAVKARKAFAGPLEEIGKNDLKLMYRCVRDLDDEPNQKWKHIIGGLGASLPPIPIYFQDRDYCRQRHEWVQEQVRLDDEMVKNLQRE